MKEFDFSKMKKISPGAYVDTDGALHFSIPEMLAELGVPDTPANRARLTKQVDEFMAAQSPETKVVHLP